MRANERPIAIGGMLRCCTKTIRESTHSTKVGDEMTCDTCQRPLYVGEDGAWRWWSPLPHPRT